MTTEFSSFYLNDVVKMCTVRPKCHSSFHAELNALILYVHIKMTTTQIQHHRKRQKQIQMLEVRHSTKIEQKR